MEKICTQCQQQKPLSAFNKNRCTPDGYDRICRECRRRNYRRRHPESRKTSIEEYTTQELIEELNRRQAEDGTPP